MPKSQRFTIFTSMEKIIIITGGSRGIGAATALLAAGQGYKVGISYREQHDAAESVVKKIIDKGGEAVAVQADVSKEDDVIRMFQDFDERLGRATALVNNVGILKQWRLMDMNATDLEWIFSTNVIGSFICAREAVKRMGSLTEGMVERLSMYHRWHQSMVHLTNTLIMLHQKGPLIPLPWD